MNIIETIEQEQIAKLGKTILLSSPATPCR